MRRQIIICDFCMKEDIRPTYSGQGWNGLTVHACDKCGTAFMLYQEERRELEQLDFKERQRINWLFKKERDELEKKVYKEHNKNPLPDLLTPLERKLRAPSEE